MKPFYSRSSWDKDESKSLSYIRDRNAKTRKKRHLAIYNSQQKTASFERQLTFKDNSQNTTEILEPKPETEILKLITLAISMDIATGYWTFFREELCSQNGQMVINTNFSISTDRVLAWSVYWSRIKSSCKVNFWCQKCSFDFRFLEDVRP